MFCNIRAVILALVALAISSTAFAQGGPSPEETAKMIAGLPGALQPDFMATLETEKKIHEAHQSGDPARIKDAELAMARSILSTMQKTKGFLQSASPEDAEKVGKVLAFLAGPQGPPAGAPMAMCDQMIAEAGKRIQQIESGAPMGGPMGGQPGMPHDPNMQPPMSGQPGMPHDPNMHPPTGGHPPMGGQPGMPHDPNMQPPMGGQPGMPHDPNMHPPTGGHPPMGGQPGMPHDPNTQPPMGGQPGMPHDPNMHPPMGGQPGMPHDPNMHPPTGGHPPMGGQPGMPHDPNMHPPMGGQPGMPHDPNMHPPMGGQPGMHQGGPGPNDVQFMQQAQQMVPSLPSALRAGYRQTLKKWQAVMDLHMQGTDWKAAVQAEIDANKSLVELMKGTKQFLGSAAPGDAEKIAKFLAFMDSEGHAPPPAGPAPTDAMGLIDKTAQHAREEIEMLQKALDSGVPPHGDDGGMPHDPNMHPPMGGHPGMPHDPNQPPMGGQPGMPHDPNMHPPMGGHPGMPHDPNQPPPMHGGQPGMPHDPNMQPPMGGHPGMPGGGSMHAPAGMRIPPECSDALRNSELQPQGTVSDGGASGNLIFRTVCARSPFETNAISLPAGRKASGFDVEAATPGKVFFGVRAEGGANVWTTADGKDAFHSLSLGEGVYQIFLDASQSDPGARVTVRFVDHP